jgi:uncharacterized protein YggE
MNKYIGIVSAVGVLVAAVLLAGAASKTTGQDPRLITVSGNAEVRVVPDEVILTLGVETWDRDLEAAKVENDQRVERILALAEQHEIEAKHVQTDHVSIEPRYDDGYEKRGFIGYFVRKTIVITLRDVERFEDLLTDVLETGATHVHGIRFQTTELRQYKDQARALAVKAAREKAEAMAGGLGQEIGEPTSIHEDETGWWSWYGGWWGSHWGGAMAQNVIQNVGEGTFAADSTLAPGQIAVNAKVTVSFELQ